ncbi:MAG: hypothetical protein QXR48_02170 [Candidatus Woesearchaeota archaeon]
MAFIHKNVNSALMLLIAFLSVTLATVTVYSVEAFDNINSIASEQAMRADELQKQLAEKEAMTDSLKQAAQLTQEREQALATLLEQQRQEAQKQTENTVTIDASQTAQTTAKQTSSATVPYNPYRNRYVWPWMAQKRYVY